MNQNMPAIPIISLRFPLCDRLFVIVVVLALLPTFVAPQDPTTYVTPTPTPEESQVGCVINDNKTDVARIQKELEISYQNYKTLLSENGNTYCLDMHYYCDEYFFGFPYSQGYQKTTRVKNGTIDFVENYKIYHMYPFCVNSTPGFQISLEQW